MKRTNTEDHAILHARGAGLTAVEDLPLPDGICNLFTIEDGKVTRIEDFDERGKALVAAGVSGDQYARSAWLGAAPRPREGPSPP